MLWVLLSLIAALGHSSNAVVNKYVLKSLSVYTVAFFSGLFSIPILLILVALQPNVIGPQFWPAAIISSVVNTFVLLLYYKAIQISEISSVIPLITFVPVFTVITSSVMLGEFPSTVGLLGIFTTVAGSFVLNGVRSLRWEKGPLLMLFIAFVWSITANLDKIAILNSNPIFYILIGNLIAGLILVPLMIYKGSFYFNAKGKKKFIFLTSMTSLFYGIAQNAALTMTLVSYVLSVKRFSALITIILGWLFFKESRIKQKLLGGFIMVAGVIIIAVFG